MVTLDSGKLIVRNGKEILIPKESQNELLNQLHLTHLSFQGIRGLPKDKFFWPGMTSALEKKYRACKPMLVIKDRVSGLILARVTKNQTTDKAFKAVIEWNGQLMHGQYYSDKYLLVFI